MTWWCGACGCVLPQEGGMVTMAPCHCGITRGQNLEPKDAKRTAACPPLAPDMRRSGIFN